MRGIVHTIALAACMVWSGCDWTEMSPVEEQLVVEAYLIAGERLPTIRLTRSASVDGVYSPDSRAVTDATVVIQRVEDDGAIAETYPYRSSRVGGGLYVPEGLEHVLPSARYTLRVTLDSGEEVTSTTTVPDTLSLVSVNRDSTVYEEEQIELTLTRSEYPGRHAYLVFTSEALDASRMNATPITTELLEQDDELTVDELRITSSPPLSEATYGDDSSEPLVITIPWLAVRFYGEQRVRISAIDDNLYDFLRSHLVQQGGSTFLPGEVPNILDHVDGGTGVFGSYAAASALVYVRRPAD